MTDNQLLKKACEVLLPFYKILMTCGIKEFGSCGCCDGARFGSGEGEVYIRQVLLQEGRLTAEVAPAFGERRPNEELKVTISGRYDDLEIECTPLYSVPQR